MKPKTYTGTTMAEVLAKIKADFGRDAVILNTRTVSKGGVLGVGKKDLIEITAAKQLSCLPPFNRRGSVDREPTVVARADGAATQVPPTIRQPTRRRPLSSSASKMPDNLASKLLDNPASRPPSTPGSSTSSEEVLMEIGALKGMVSDLVGETRRSRVPEVPDALFSTYQRLIENDVADRIAQELVLQIRRNLPEDQLHNERAVRAQLVYAIEPMIPDAGPLRIVSKPSPTLIALVGPTGVGKTTTVAKLAANFCLREKRRVGLVTIDTYRIAAIEQLKTYAEIINVPLEVASSARQLQEAVARLSDREIILIDTAGRSQRDEVKINELKAIFEVVPPDETHLVLAGTSGERVMAQAIDRFATLGVNRLILTKLDEAIGFGVILSCLKKAKAGLSYITTGQDVPDDIEVGERRAIARLIAGERTQELSATA